MDVFNTNEYQQSYHPNKSVKTVIRRLQKKMIPTNHTVIKKGRTYVVIVDDDIRVKKGLPFDVTIKGIK